MTIGIIVSMCGLGLGIASNLILLAFGYGRLKQRVDNAIEQLHELADSKTAIAVHNERLGNILVVVEGLQSTLRNGITDKINAIDKRVSHIETVCTRACSGRGDDS